MNIICDLMLDCYDLDYSAEDDKRNMPCHFHIIRFLQNTMCSSFSYLLPSVYLRSMRLTVLFVYASSNKQEIAKNDPCDNFSVHSCILLSVRA